MVIGMLHTRANLELPAFHHERSIDHLPTNIQAPAKVQHFQCCGSEAHHRAPPQSTYWNRRSTKWCPLHSVTTHTHRICKVTLHGGFLFVEQVCWREEGKGCIWGLEGVGPVGPPSWTTKLPLVAISIGLMTHSSAVLIPTLEGRSAHTLPSSFPYYRGFTKRCSNYLSSLWLQTNKGLSKSFLHSSIGREFSHSSIYI